jgi:type IV secretion system protein VirD4
MKLQMLKKQLIVFFIVYLLIDVVLVGSFLVTESQIPSNITSFDRFSKTVADFPTVIVNPFNVIFKIFSNSNILSSFLTASCYTLIICAVGFIYWHIKNGKKYDFQGTEHGSSDWANWGEEYRKLPDGKEMLNRKRGFILSKKHYLGTDLRKVGINKNVLVIGGSGTGKSACYIKPNILQQLGSYVITDPKGELYRETSQYLKNAGYKVKTLNLVNPEYSDRYNPLAHIRDHKDIDIIAHTIVTGVDSSGAHADDPFWDNTAKMLLKACIYYVISVLPEEEQNLSSCLNIVRAGGADETVLDRLFLDELSPEHPGRKEYEGIRLGAEKTKQSIVISLVSKLSHFDTPSMKRITTTNDIDFDELGERKTVLYVITPAEHGAYNYILTIFFSQLLQTLYSKANKNGGTLDNQVYLLLDEFPNIGQIPDFNKILSTTRSLGISISIVVQSLDQLEGLYKDTYENIIGNCDTQLFLGSQSTKTCEYISKSLGQKTIKYYNKSISNDKDEVSKQGVSFSEQRQGRELMTIDELKRLDYNLEIILVRGIKPIKAKKAWYFKYHPMKDIAKQTEIHNIKEMPKSKEVEILSMDVQEHLNEREKKAKESKKEVVKPENTTSQIEKPTDNQEKFDLQKELEKKFDELFGTDGNH